MKRHAQNKHGLHDEPPRPPQNPPKDTGERDTGVRYFPRKKDRE